MGLVLKPSEVKSAAQQIRTNINDNKTGYGNALQVIQRFAENEDLNSESWNTAKFNMSVAHQLIMQGMQAAQEAILQDLNTLEASIGEEDLDEDELIADIERLTNECICYEEAIRNLQRMSGRSILNGYSGIQTAIGNYKALLEHTRAELELMKEKLEKLRETSQITSELLNSSEPLLQAIQNAINDTEVYITGTGTFSDGEWRMVIPEMIETLNIGKENEWIPPVMQLDGETEQEKLLKERINNLNKNSALKWNQEKIDRVWEICGEYYEKTGVQVDPRLMIAIVICEGNGSFNTSNKNIAADGENGMNVNFEEDAELAVDLVGGKLAAYAYFQEDFSSAREEAYEKGLAGIKDYDDILHYIQWTTPRVSFESNSIVCGEYASGSDWNRQVREVYSELAYDTAPHDYTEYALSLGADKLVQIADDNGMDIISVEFKADQNKNQIYTIIGIKR